ncbi:MAG: site-specific integrase [Planctomycetota bacterium]
MATIAKKTYTKPIPKGAEVVSKGGKRIARFKSRGKVIEAPLTDDGSSCRIESRHWYVRYQDATGKWKRRKGYTDKDATAALAVKIERRIARQREGLVDPFEAHHRRPRKEHLADFEANLRDRDVGDVAGIIGRACKVLDACRFEGIMHISASAVQASLAELRKARDWAPQTYNHYLRSVRQFTRWLVCDRRTDQDALTHLSMLNVRTDRRHDRRALELEEVNRLIESALSGPPIEGILGPDRAMLYVLSGWTGFRWKELHSLTGRSVRRDLESSTPSIRVGAAYAKNRRTDNIELHPELAGWLRTWMESKTEIDQDAPLFPLRTPGGWWRKTGKMMRMDLERARASWIDEAESERERQRREESGFLCYQSEDGLYADFHAHRHTFITNLARGGVPDTMRQKLARHSTGDLTNNVYTHPHVSDRMSAIESLPRPPVPGAKKADPEPVGELLATGTDDAQPTGPDESGPYMGHRIGRRTHGSARRRTKATESEEDEEGCKTVKLHELSTGVR